MNHNDQSPDRTFDELVRRARGDQPDAIDSAALLRAVRRQEILRYTWWDELATVFDIRGALTACATGATALFVVGAWMAYDAWAHVLPWAEFLGDPSSILPGGSL